MLTEEDDDPEQLWQRNRFTDGEHDVDETEDFSHSNNFLSARNPHHGQQGQRTGGWLQRAEKAVPQLKFKLHQPAQQQQQQQQQAVPVKAEEVPLEKHTARATERLSMSTSPLVSMLPSTYSNL